jgi:hypothetical protein
LHSEKDLDIQIIGIFQDFPNYKTFGNFWNFSLARVAKLVDALSSGGSIRKVVSRFNRDPGHKKVLELYRVF